MINELTTENINEFMREALLLAYQGAGDVSPNPLVGAVVVSNNKIIGRGFHEKYGSAHAEVNALKGLIKSDLKDAILFCTLEPCCHTNKQTPPCCDLIIKSGIKTVYIGMLDSNPQVSGNGVKTLEAAGIMVYQGYLAGEISLMNAGFFHYIKEKTPYYHLKWAQTLDGKISTSTGDSKWITNSESRKQSHIIRRISDVIITSAGTVRSDNPKLNSRLEGLNNYTPYRIILTNSGDLPMDADIFNYNKEKTLIFNAGEKDLSQFKAIGIEVIQTKPKKILHDIDNWIKERNLTTVMIEGGPKLITSYLKADLYHHVHIFIAPKLLGEGLECVESLNINKVANALSFKKINWNILQGDLYFSGIKE
jgi:diaminohydroxyphosphoribosylaminopyrimidine deaminase/5-amino-6-(5-phosphoribosylamino)uracil reductase